MPTREIISIVIAGLAGLVWAIVEIRKWKKDRRARKIEADNDLMPNPTRCADHEARLRLAEQTCYGVAAMKEDIAEIKSDVKSLIGLHLKD